MQMWGALLDNGNNIEKYIYRYIYRIQKIFYSHLWVSMSECVCVSEHFSECIYEYACLFLSLSFSLFSLSLSL